MDLKLILEQLNQEIAGWEYGQTPKELYEPISYIMGLGGKRMRPLLTILGYSLFKDNIQQIFKPAMAVEVFHNFTLMHDDIMDKAPLRRGKPTVHHQWNENIAILSGDVMLVCAYQLLTYIEEKYLLKALQLFNQCAAEVCEGQQLDMNFESIPIVEESEYIEMIRRKTAVLLGFALELGGLMAGESEANLSLLRAFGENIGIGFQLKDDLLDVYGDSEKFGKQVGGDIIANKKTFLLIKALEKSPTHIKINLLYWLNQREFDKEQKVKAVTDIYNQLHIKSITEQKIQTYFDSSFEILDKIQADASKKQFLKQFIEEILHREK